MANKTIVYVQANVLSVSDVDTVTQTYNVEAAFKLRYAASKQDKQNWAIYNDLVSDETKDEESIATNNNMNGDKPDEFIPKYIPKLSFPNASECELNIKDGNKEFFKIMKDDPDFIVYDFQIRCTFGDTFELENFPFDCQDLPIMMKLGNQGGTKNNALMPDITKKNFGKVDLSNCVLTQWKIHPTLIEFGETDPALSKSGNKAYPLFVLRIKVERRYQFYLQRIALILAALSLSSLTAYAVDVGDIADRLGIDFTLLLTVVAFQQTVTDSLPVLPFVTIMDLFVLLSIGFIFMITVQHSLMPSNSEDLDRFLLFIFLGIWIIAHIGFAIYCPILAYKERKKLAMNSVELKKYLKEEGKILAHKFETDNDHIKQIENGEWVSFISKTQ